MRQAVAGVPPVLGDLGLDPGLASILVAIPVVCFSLGALAGPALRARLGEERAIFLVVTAVGLVGLLLFRRDPAHDLFLDRLYFVTRAGPLWGVSTAALARLSYRVATDPHWQPDRDAYLRDFLRWCQALAEPTETPDVLRLYAGTVRRARQILLASR